MNNLKKVLIVIGIVLIIAIIAIVIIFKTKGDSGRLLKLYNNIKNNEKFTFEMKEKNENMEYTVSMSQSGKNFSIDTFMEDEHSATLVLEGKIYSIDHNNQEYYELDEQDEDFDLESDIYILENGLEAITKNKYTTGKEEIEGKKYFYEEYDNDNGDFTIFAETTNNSKIKTRFYFDGDKIAYIKHFISSEEEKSEELLKVNLKYEVNDDLFKIPEDYAETNDMF